MKKTTILIIVVLFMVIGYAAYNTTINIYGNGKLAENLSDFKVYLSNLKVNGKEVNGINNTKDEFTINDINGDISVDVINDSTEYDTESYLECDVDNTWDFDYTGGEQTFTAPITGTYKLETWGAQGGTVDTSYYGGYGGYSTGTIKQTKGNIMYVNVGGKGTGATKTGESLIGGYNGGGNVTGSSTVNHMTASGGGATHIASISGLLSTLENNKNDIFIVSGGGGGGRNQANHSEAARWGFGGSGGGMNGVGPKSSLESTTSYTVVSSLAGTQTSGYAFGQGESVGVQSAGGGGFYGGYSGSEKRSLYTGSGAGGSGYIGNSLLTEKSMYCYGCIESNETSTKTISTTCTSATPTAACAKQGNGYARITLVSAQTNITTDKATITAQESSNQNIKNTVGKSLTCKLKVNKISRTEKKIYNGPTEWTYDYTGGEQTFTAPIRGKYKIKIWGAQGGSSSNNSTYGGYNGSQAIGGYGGYSSGILTLSKNQKLNIVVGGGGTSSGMNEFSVAKGGYNGGGNGGKGNTSFYSIGCYSGAGGGGATHVAFSTGLLSGFKDNLSELLIVAGGGGGAINHNIENNNGGSAGGIYGNAGSFLKVTTCNTNLPKISGGTQISGYLFGMGQTGRDAVNVNCGQSGAAGGGGGFYGGMSQTENYDTSTGAGGSGYIGNSLLTEKSMYCYNCTESSEESTKTISTTCTNATPTANCAKSGNGYARITLISTD